VAFVKSVITPAQPHPIPRDPALDPPEACAVEPRGVPFGEALFFGEKANGFFEAICLAQGVEQILSGRRGRGVGPCPDLIASRPHAVRQICARKVALFLEHTGFVDEDTGSKRGRGSHSKRLVEEFRAIREPALGEAERRPKRRNSRLFKKIALEARSRWEETRRRQSKAASASTRVPKCLPRVPRCPQRYHCTLAPQAESASSLRPTARPSSVSSNGKLSDPLLATARLRWRGERQLQVTELGMGLKVIAPAAEVRGTRSRAPRLRPARSPSDPSRVP